MRKWTVRAARAVLVGAAFAAVGTGIANADTDHNNTRGDRSLLGGLMANANVPVSAPNLLAGSANNLLGGNTVDASGNNVQLLSPRSTASSGSSTHRLRYVYHHSRNIEATSLGGGDQGKAPVSAPILICGNAIADNGLGTAACRGNSSISSGAASTQANPACPAACAPAAQMPAQPAQPAQPAAPVCAAACTQAQEPAKPAAPAAPACAQTCTQVGAPVCHEACTQSSAQSTDSSASHLIGRDQASVPVAAPITICGNAVPVRGLAAAACEGNASFTRS